MNRRDFLKRMGLAGLVLATPKLIFDMGKNSHLYADDPNLRGTWCKDGFHPDNRIQLIEREMRTAEYSVREIQDSAHFKAVFEKYIKNINAQLNYYKEIEIGNNFIHSLL